ncbi:MAG: YdcF family protein [Bradymonadaceae bacterium]|nr:YdcF family protein [Lujinxingiaceae bacterium]
MRRRTKRAIALLATVLTVTGIGWGSALWVERYSQAFIYEQIEAVPSRPTAIVLGARVYADGSPSPALQDRLHAALDLYRAGKVRRILVSGDHGRHGYDEVNAMHAWLIERDVPVEDVFLDHAGFRTLDTMERARQIFEVREAIVCTQRFHQHRSVFLARRAGIDAVGLVADRRVYLHEGANARREFVARVMAVADSYLLKRSPRYLGDPIPIDGEATASHDRKTQLGKGQ